ncbi:hypothetical protein [Asaia prunellae]|uniref:hypothetical protein n=1 Tax=Asaia prunellae TaxID=610245 RepID=UPI000470F489|nr:hypothetical protein [Asaia prunellae]
MRALSLLGLVAFTGMFLISGAVARRQGFSTVLPLQVNVPVEVTPDYPVTSAGKTKDGWEPAPLPHAMSPPPLRRTTAGKIVNFAKRFLPGEGGASGHDLVTGASIAAFGTAYQNGSLVSHGLAPPGETVGR